MCMRLVLSCALILAGAAPAAAGEMRPYLRAGIGGAVSGDATFSDANCDGRTPAALFGCGGGPDGKPLGAYGDFGSSVQFDVAAGVELTDYLRVEVAIGYRPGFAFDGNANFPRVGDDQPVSGEVTQTDAMAFAYLEPLAAAGVDMRLQPFIGAGFGLSHNVTERMTYDFPGARQPRYSVTPGGATTEFAWAVSAGLSYEVSDTLVLDLAWRYSDFGKVETDRGTLFNQFSTRTLDIEIGETEAELTSHAVSVSARWRF